MDLVILGSSTDYVVACASVKAIGTSSSEDDVIVSPTVRPGDPLVGAAVAVDAPPPGVLDSERFRWLEEAARSGGGQLEMAVRLPIRIDEEAAPGTKYHWIAVVEREPDPRIGPLDPDRLSLDEISRLLPASEDGDRAVASPDGYGVPGMSVLMLQVRVEVIDHSLRPPPGENQDRRKDKRRDRDDDPLRKPPGRTTAGLAPVLGR